MTVELLAELWEKWLVELCFPGAHDRHLRADHSCSAGGRSCSVCDDLDEIRAALACFRERGVIAVLNMDRTALESALAAVKEERDAAVEEAGKLRDAHEAALLQIGQLEVDVAREAQEKRAARGRMIDLEQETGTLRATAIRRLADCGSHLIALGRPDLAPFGEQIVCPRCDGQTYDRGSCGLCRNIGWLDENGEALTIAALSAAERDER